MATGEAREGIVENGIGIRFFSGDPRSPVKMFFAPLKNGSWATVDERAGTVRFIILTGPGQDEYATYNIARSNIIESVEFPLGVETGHEAELVISKVRKAIGW